MKLLPRWIFTKGLGAFYDGESATCMEQTFKVYEAMNSLITEYNEFVDTTNKTITDFVAESEQNFDEFAIGLRQEFQDFIDTIDLKVVALNQAFDELKGDWDVLSADLRNELATSLSEFNTSFTTTITNLVETMFTEYKAEIDAQFISQLSDFEETILTMQGIVNTWKTKIESLERLTSQHTTKINENAANIEGLQTQVNELSGSLDDIDVKPINLVGDPTTASKSATFQTTDDFTTKDLYFTKNIMSEDGSTVVPTSIKILTEGDGGSVELEGTEENPIILDGLQSGWYKLKGYFKYTSINNNIRMICVENPVTNVTSLLSYPVIAHVTNKSLEKNVELYGVKIKVEKNEIFCTTSFNNTATANINDNYDLLERPNGCVNIRYNDNNTNFTLTSGSMNPDIKTTIDDAVANASGSGVTELEGTQENPVLLTDLEYGTYLITGYYKFHSSNSKALSIGWYSGVTSPEYKVTIRVINNASSRKTVIFENCILGNYASTPCYRASLTGSSLQSVSKYYIVPSNANTYVEFYYTGDSSCNITSVSQGGLPAQPSEDGEYKLVVSDGVASWVKVV